MLTVWSPICWGRSRPVPGGQSQRRRYPRRRQREHRRDQRIPHARQAGGDFRAGGGRPRVGWRFLLAGGCGRFFPDAGRSRGIGLDLRGAGRDPGPQLHVLALFQRRQRHRHLGRRPDGLVPTALLVILAVFVIVLAVSRYVSLASVALRLPCRLPPGSRAIPSGSSAHRRGHGGPGQLQAQSQIAALAQGHGTPAGARLNRRPIGGGQT